MTTKPKVVQAPVIPPSLRFVAQIERLRSRSVLVRAPTKK